MRFDLFFKFYLDIAVDIMQCSSAPMQIEIQLATLSQLEQVVAIIHQNSKWLKSKGINQWSESFPVARLEAELSKGELFVVLDQSRKIIGTLSLSKVRPEHWPDSKDRPAIYLSRLAILREYAGLNLGVRIIGRAREYSRQQNVDLLRLKCDKTNPFLSKFYLRCGFKCVGEYYFSPWRMTFSLFEIEV
jgi:GNAT superfamily N-acetyltransferase